MARKENATHVGKREEESQISKVTLAQRARRERERILKQSTVRGSEQLLPGDTSVQTLQDSNIAVHAHEAPIGSQISKAMLAQRTRRQQERILKQSTVRQSEQHLPGDTSVQAIRDNNIAVHVHERKTSGERIQMADNTPRDWSKMTLRDLLYPKYVDSLSGIESTTKKRRTGGGQDEEEQQAAAAASKEIRGTCSNFLALTDPDLLDCPICFNNLTIPVFQCFNGHLACSSCCIEVRNKCPCGSSTIGHNRCRPIEKIIGSVKTSCQNQKYGCTEMVFRSKQCDHKDMCIYAPCSCPLPDCEFVGSSKKLSLHFSTKHSGSAKHFVFNCSIEISLELQQKYVILQEEQEGIIYILNNGVQNLGNVINVCCIAPISSKRGFSYNLLATNGGRSVELQSFTEHVCGRVEHTSPKNFLMVPSAFFGSCGQLKLELRISGSQGVVHS